MGWALDETASPHLHLPRQQANSSSFMTGHSESTLADSLVCLRSWDLYFPKLTATQYLPKACGEQLQFTRKGLKDMFKNVFFLPGSLREVPVVKQSTWTIIPQLLTKMSLDFNTLNFYWKLAPKTFIFNHITVFFSSKFFWMHCPLDIQCPLYKHLQDKFFCQWNSKKKFVSVEPIWCFLVIR